MNIIYIKFIRFFVDCEYLSRSVIIHASKYEETQMNKDKLLLYFALKYNGDFNQIYGAICNQEPIDFNDFNKVISTAKYKYITLYDHRYPEYLKDKPNPPIVLFYHGNINLINNSIVEPKYGELIQSKNRFLSTVFPTVDNNHLVFDYVIMVESQKDLDFLKNHVKSKGVPLKNYDKIKDKNLER